MLEESLLEVSSSVVELSELFSVESCVVSELEVEDDEPEELEVEVVLFAPG